MFSNKSKGLRLKEERKGLGKTQTEFAEFCGYSKRTQIKYEKGEVDIHDLYLLKAGELGVDVGYILTGTKTDFINLADMPKPSMTHLLLSNSDLLGTVLVINKILGLAGIAVTDASKFKKLLTMYIELEKNQPYSEAKEHFESVLLTMAKAL
jgi:transcriptional regulator with XRE-family HTH domain